MHTPPVESNPQNPYPHYSEPREQAFSDVADYLPSVIKIQPRKLTAVRKRPNPRVAPFFLIRRRKGMDMATRRQALSAKELSICKFPTRRCASEVRGKWLPLAFPPRRPSSLLSSRSLKRPAELSSGVPSPSGSPLHCRPAR